MEKTASKKLKVCSIFGTRPEAVKMAPVVLELQRRPEFDHVLVVTGQHRSMLDQMLLLFGLKPDHDLDIMKERQTLTMVTTGVLEGMESILAEERPDVVLVHGDTSTSFVSGLAAYYQQIPVGHVEAGLRTGNKYNPFPEEMNRRLIDTICSIFFAPTETAASQLRKENINDGIYITGNTVIDALLSVADMPEPADTLPPEIPPDAPMVLVEAHRRENLGEPMRQICLALRDLAEKYEAMHIVFPVHKNPAVRDTVFEVLSDLPRVHLLEPSGYLPFVFMMKRARFILTDSGGIQEEAPSLGTPVLVLRTTTERPEAVEAGTARVIGHDYDRILKEASLLMDDEEHYKRMSTAKNPYGDGAAARRTADALLHYFGITPERPEDYLV